MHDEHCPFGEPADPSGVDGFVRDRDNWFSLSHRNTREETDFGYHTDLYIRFLPR